MSSLVPTTLGRAGAVDRRAFGWAHTQLPHLKELSGGIESVNGFSTPCPAPAQLQALVLPDVSVPVGGYARVLWCGPSVARLSLDRAEMFYDVTHSGFDQWWRTRLPHVATASRSVFSAVSGHPLRPA